jgi:hypothetical protein
LKPRISLTVSVSISQPNRPPSRRSSRLFSCCRQVLYSVFKKLVISRLFAAASVREAVPSGVQQQRIIWPRPFPAHGVVGRRLSASRRNLVFIAIAIIICFPSAINSFRSHPLGCQLRRCVSHAPRAARVNAAPFAFPSRHTRDACFSTTASFFIFNLRVVCQTRNPATAFPLAGACVALTALLLKRTRSAGSHSAAAVGGATGEAGDAAGAAVSPRVISLHGLV